MASFKTGKLSATEKDFIKENAKKLSYDSIAKELNRKPAMVKDYISYELQVGERSDYDIEKKPYWKEILNQFDEDELGMFKYHWGAIVEQFSNDITPSEEIQMLDLIKVEILMNRILKEHKDCINTTRQYEMKAAEAEEKFGPNSNEQNNFEALALESRASTMQKTKEFQDFMGKKQAIMKDLKVTRDQRVKVVQDSRTTFTALLDALNEQTTRDRVGREIAVMKKASQIELERLAEAHMFMDGMEDCPILSEETLQLNEKKEKELTSGKKG